MSGPRLAVYSVVQAARLFCVSEGFFAQSIKNRTAAAGRGAMCVFVCLFVSLVGGVRAAGVEPAARLVVGGGGAAAECAAAADGLGTDPGRGKGAGSDEVVEVEAYRPRSRRGDWLSHDGAVGLERAVLLLLEGRNLACIGDGELLHSSRTVLGLGGAGDGGSLGLRSLSNLAVSLLLAVGLAERAGRLE